MLSETVALLRDLKFEFANYFEPLVQNVLSYVEKILDNCYLLRSYIQVSEEKLSATGRKIRKNYRKLIRLRDEFSSIQKSRKSALA